MQTAVIVIVVLAIVVAVIWYRVNVREGIDPSFVSATISKSIDDEAVIDDVKLKALSVWFARHSWGWREFIVPPPCLVWFILTYRDGRRVKVGLSREKPARSGRHRVIYAFKGKLKDNARRGLSAEECASLFSILEL